MAGLQWRGGEQNGNTVLDAALCHSARRPRLHYHFEFASDLEHLDVVDEFVQIMETQKTASEFLYRLESGIGLVELTTAPSPDGTQRTHNMLPRSTVKTDESVLAQFGDPVRYPELTSLADDFSRIAMFGRCRFGPWKPPRAPVFADAPGDFLLEDGSNLALVLNDLINNPPIRKTLFGLLKQVYDRFEENQPGRESDKKWAGIIRFCMPVTCLSSPIWTPSVGALRTVRDCETRCWQKRAVLPAADLPQHL